MTARELQAHLDRKTRRTVLCGGPKCVNRGTILGAITVIEIEGQRPLRTGVVLRPEFKQANDGVYAVSGHDRRAQLDPHWHRSFHARDVGQSVQLPAVVRCYVCREAQQLDADRLDITEWPPRLAGTP